MRTRCPAYIVGICLMMDPEEAVGVNTRNDECVESKQVYVCFWDWVYMAGPFGNSDWGRFHAGFNHRFQSGSLSHVLCQNLMRVDVLSKKLYYLLLWTFPFIHSVVTWIKQLWRIQSNGTRNWKLLFFRTIVGIKLVLSVKRVRLSSDKKIKFNK